MSNQAGAHHPYGAQQGQPGPLPPPSQGGLNFQHEEGDDDDVDDEDDGPSKKSTADKKAGRRKIKIEFINDKSRRHITFSKRKAGIMKKAYELSTLTGTQVLLLVVSETGLVYTFTTAKLQPLVTQPEGKNLIQACLNSPPGQIPTGAPIGVAGSSVHQAAMHPPGPPVPHPLNLPPPGLSQRNVPGGLSIDETAGNEDEENEDEDDLPPGGTSDPPTPPSATIPPQTPSQASGRHSHHPRTAQSAHGAHHGAHPYGGAQNPAREAHNSHRRGASGSAKVASPRNEPISSPTLPQSAYGHDPSMYGHPGHSSDPSGRMMGYPPPGPPPGQYAGSWNGMRGAQPGR